MVDIPDEAVQAFIERYELGCNHRYDENSIRAALIAALPYLPLGYEVKKLEWGSENPYHVARTRIGSYCIEVVWEDGKLEYVSLSGSLHAIKKFKSVAEAKAAAQADFERRVRECLVAKPVDVASVLNSAALIVEGRSTSINSDFIQKLSKKNIHEIATLIAEHDKELGTAIRALSTEPAQGEQWQPIETAPKDGTWILAFYHKYCVPAIIFYDNEWKRWAGCADAGSNHFTHWMPLPAAPSLEAK